MYQFRRTTVSISAVMLVILALASACVPVARKPGAVAVVSESLATAEPTRDLRAVPVEHVTLEVGVGSPIPVDIVVSGSWPDLCAQLAAVDQRMVGFQMDIAVLTTSADPGCPPDYVGLPFRIAIPLNVVELPEGAYTVSVNGVTTMFELPVQTPAVGDTPTDEPTADEQASFEAELERMLVERNFEPMPAVMDDTFVIAGWRSEGTA